VLVTDPRDDLDTWLQKQIDPMLPPPGTFDLIRKRARRRKARQALVSAASAGVVAAVVVLAVVALPKVVPSVLNPHKTVAANGGTAPPTAASVGASPLKTSPAVKPSGGTGLPQVPPNFQATSVTFVGLGTGWVIGQAGTPGHCASPYCTSVARTDNTGTSWYGVPAPKTGAPDGSTGVGQIRFLNTEDGWAFGPELWSTHNAGQSWTPVNTGGQRVLSLETVGSEAFAIFAQCTGAGADYGSDCTSYTLYASPAGSDNWQPVPGMSAVVPVGAAAGSGGSAALVLTPTVGYFYTPNGTILSGPVTGTQPWTAVSVATPPCEPGAPAGSAQQPSAGLLASSGPGNDDLALACAATSGSGQQVQIYTSTDGGSAWSAQGKVTLDGQVTALAANSGGELILAWSGGLDASANNGATWVNQEAAVSGGFSYVGLTDAAQGVAVPEQPQQQAVWFTQSGGRQPWLVSAVRS
jgi:hypothetical protein